MQQFSLPAQPLRYAILGTRLGLKKHPLAGKALPTSIGFAFGDCLTQVSGGPVGVLVCVRVCM